MIDQDIIDRIKRDIILGDTSDSLILTVVESDTKERYCFSECCFDEMMEALFKWSMTKNIVDIRHYVGGYDNFTIDNIRAFNGSPCPIIGYTFVIEESPNHQTNITPRLMKFLEVVLTRSGLSKLAYPDGQRTLDANIVANRNHWGVPIFTVPDDPWIEFEKYLNS